MLKKKPKVKSNKAIKRAEAHGRVAAFNKELNALSEKYQVKLNVSQRIVVVDNKPFK